MLENLFKKTLRRQGLTLWHLMAVVMWVVSLGYRLGYWWMRRRSHDVVRLPVPVVSIGNVTVGGTGKTPFVSFLAHDLIQAGLRVGIVSRGYGRADREAFVAPGYEIAEMMTDRTGDEVMLLATQLPDALFSVDEVKAQAAQRLVAEAEVDVIIVDDGFQHWRLHRDIDLVTFDAAVPDRMLKWFPLGLLREPLSALDRADFVIATRANFAADLGRLKRRLQELAPRAELYSAQFVITEMIGRDRHQPLKYLEDKSVFLFAGVGNFIPLRKQVAALCADLEGAWELPDHQRYDRDLLERIKQAADERHADLILTTGKDWVKMPGFDFKREIYYLGQAIDLDPGEERLIDELIGRLGLPRRDN